MLFYEKEPMFESEYCKIHGNRYVYKGEAQNYNIEIAGKKYICHGYEKYEIKVPYNPPTEPKKTSVLKEIAKGIVDVGLAMTTGNFFFDDSKESDVLLYSNISVLELWDEKERKRIYVITSSDKQKIQEVILCGARNVSSNPDTSFEKVCKEIFLELEIDKIDNFLKKSSHNEKDLFLLGDVGRILYGYHKNRPYAITVDSLDCVIAQFENQDIAYKAWKENEPIRIAQECKNMSDIIINDFKQTSLLCEKSLTNKSKENEYLQIRDFCLKYLPELSEREFDEDKVVSTYFDYVTEEACKTFFANWKRLCRSYTALARGAQGEEKVAEVLKLFDDRVRILRNYTLGYEHDFIVIAPTGIFTIEVKNLYGEYVLTETGILKSLTRPHTASKDIALQSKKHLETLRRNLKECTAFNDKIPLQEIICSAEPQFSIKDEYHYLPICYYNTIDKFLLPADRVKVLTEKTMDKIEAYLLEHQEQERVYDVFLPRGEIDSRDRFINSFAEVASGVSCANKDNGINEQAQ